MAEEEVGLRTTLKDRIQTARGLDEIDRKVTGVGRSAETAGRRAAIGARGFDHLKRAGRLAAVGVGAAFTATIGLGYGLLRLIRSSFDEAREAQKVGALTRSTIKSTGGAAKVSAVHVEKLSTRLSEMAGIDDELIQTGDNVLLTFKNIRNELGKGNKIFDRTTKAAVNLSATPLLKGNLTSASKMLGKALNDPLKGISALTKAGVGFNDQQVDAIKNMVEHNNLLGAQKIILKEVNSQVGGAAKSQRTWGDVASVTFKNIEERLGTDLLPMFDRFGKWFSRKGGPQLDHYLDIFENKGLPAIGRFLRKAQPLANQVLPSVATALGDVRDVLSVAAPYAADMVGAFKDMPPWARKAIVGGALAGFVGSKTGVFSGLKGLLGSKGGGGLAGLVSKAKPVPVFVTNQGWAGAKSGGGAPIITGDPRAKRAPKGRPSRIGGKFGGVGGLLAALGLGAGAAATSGDLSNTLTGASIGSFAGPWGTLFGAGLGATWNSMGTPLPKDSGILAYEKDLASRENFAESLSGGTEGPKLLDLLSASIDGVMGKVASTDVQAVTLGGHLTRVGKTKVAPGFTTPGLSDSQRKALDYRGVLGDVGKPVVTHISADTSRAVAAVDALAAHTRAVLDAAVTGFFGSGGTTAPTTPTVKPPKGPPTPTTDPADKLPNLRLEGGPTVLQLVVDGKVLAETTTKQHRRKLDDQ